MLKSLRACYSGEDTSVDARQTVLAGVETTFTLVATDEFGNPTGSTEEDFYASYGGEQVLMVSNGDGTYTGTYTPSAEQLGADSPDAVLSIYLDGQVFFSYFKNKVWIMLLFLPVFLF